MSYILEALKKSDKERQREQIPDLQADHSPPIEKRQGRKPPVLHLLSAVVLVLGSVGAISWWQFSNTRMPELRGESKVRPAPLPVVQTKESGAPVISRKSVTVTPKASEQVAEEQIVEEQIVEDPTVEEQGAEGIAEVGTVATPIETPESPEQDALLVPLLDELPPNVKSGIPDLTFAGHVYASEAKNRLIIINNRIVREGDMVSNELSLEQINSDGVILRHKSVVFRVQLF